MTLNVSGESAVGEATPGIPRHVAIIMDGNGRWANVRGLPRLAGHRAGTKNIQVFVGVGVLRGEQRSGLEFLRTGVPYGDQNAA